MRTFSLFLLALVFPVALLAQPVTSAVVFELGYGYTYIIPDGWKNDPKAAGDMLINTALHPDSTKWTKAPVVMYSNITFKSSPSQTFEEVVEADIKNFTKDSPGVKAKKLDPIRCFPQNMEAAVVEFVNPLRNNYERVAYFDDGEHAVMFVIGSRSKEQYEKCLPDFEGIVRSYYNLED